MGFLDGLTYLPRKNKIIILAAIAVVVVATVVGCVIFANTRYTATSMRLLRVEGSVKVIDSNGKNKFVKKNARFQSGESITTLSNGLATVGLDEGKSVTLQPSSWVGNLGAYVLFRSHLQWVTELEILQSSPFSILTVLILILNHLYPGFKPWISGLVS